MSILLINILYFVVLIGLMILTFTLGKKYVFSKVRINKWIPLAIAAVLLIVQIFFKSINPWINMGLSIVIVWFFLWFFDIQSTGGPKKKEKKIEIRPKAKPNRVKHMQDQKK
ncbi:MULTISPECIES: hypothetical protein [Clostridium]|uniref:hypothetical protein n=1 Tax=Clostridium TaxID=1485 RepID=UPI00232E579B|nr:MULTISPECIES: hypothetical protein [Clostridium]MDB1970140.1 hypothetical protein [Clostridium tertium]MDU3406895.1 hypothetical protein [Clostridium sp.]MDU7362040.1 hypothetical protein [Clostridium sp.]